MDFLNGLVSVMRFELQVRKPEGWDIFEDLTKTAKEYWTAYVGAGNLKDSSATPKDGAAGSGGKGDGNKSTPKKTGKSGKGQKGPGAQEERANNKIPHTTYPQGTRNTRR